MPLVYGVGSIVEGLRRPQTHREGEGGYGLVDLKPVCPVRTGTFRHRGIGHRQCLPPFGLLNPDTVTPDPWPLVHRCFFLAPVRGVAILGLIY